MDENEVRNTLMQLYGGDQSSGGASEDYVPEEHMSGGLGQAIGDVNQAEQDSMDVYGMPKVSRKELDKAQAHLDSVTNDIIEQQKQVAAGMDPRSAGLGIAAQMALLGGGGGGYGSFGTTMGRGMAAAAPYVRAQEGLRQNAIDKMNELRLRAASIEQQRQVGLLKAQGLNSYHMQRGQEILARAGLRRDENGNIIADPDLMKAQGALAAQKERAKQEAMWGAMFGPGATSGAGGPSPTPSTSGAATTGSNTDTVTTPTDATITDDGQVKVNQNADPSKILADPNAPGTMLLNDKPKGVNEDALAGIRPEIANLIRGISAGRVAMSPYSAHSPYGLKLLSLVSAYDPTFDATNFNSRNKTRQSFASGADADNVTAIQTNLYHLDKLWTDFTKLNNSGFAPSIVNGPTNWAEAELSPDPKVRAQMQSARQAVNMDIEAVSHELAKVFRKSGMSEKEITDWKKSLNANSSNAGMWSSIQSAVGLMDGRLDALSDKYNNGMSTAHENVEFLHPKARAVYSKFKGDMPEPTATPTAGNANRGGAGTTENTNYPMQLRKGNKTVTVTSDDEYKEATGEGWQ